MGGHTSWQREAEKAMAKTAANPAQFDCFGLHEWAMVYKTDSPRHDLPLRLGAAGTKGPNFHAHLYRSIVAWTQPL